MNVQSVPDGRVIVVGSINIDMVMRLPRLPVAGQTVLGGVLSRHHGGKGANQAVAASRAGARVHMIGAVGRQDGEQPVAALAAEGVNVEFVAQVDGPTGHALVLVDDGTGENQIAVAPGANAGVSVDHVDEALTALDLRAADVVLLSFELPGTPLRVAAGVAGWIGARLVINPAPARPDYDDLLANAITTPNAGELAALTGGAVGTTLAGTDLPAAATALARRTGAPVIVTIGADGALLADGSRTEHFAGHRVDVRDATGAGDTLTGVLAASLATGYELTLSLRRAVAASALAVTREGARTGMPTAAEIDRLLG